MSELTLAVHNNAVWCDSVARAHRLEVHSTVACWLCTQPMPPFYPNLVTLAADDASQRVQLDYIERLLAHDLPAGWGVKDSYACLDLASLGFRILLDAQWYARAPAPMTATEGARVVRDRAELSAWIDAWGQTPPDATIFPAALLDDPSVRFVHAPDLRAGLVAAGTAEVIGISNLFGSPDGVVACIAAVVQASPTAMLVGWGDNVEITHLAPSGFRALGPLRVWVRR